MSRNAMRRVTKFLLRAALSTCSAQKQMVINYRQHRRKLRQTALTPLTALLPAPLAALMRFQELRELPKQN